MDVLELLDNSINLNNYIVILPAISVSNVGQLAVDLLIQSTRAERLCSIWSEAFIPIVGAHPFDDGLSDMCCEFEVYVLKEPKVLMFQLRSPVWQNKEEEFLNGLIRLFGLLKVKTVVILSSMADYERTDCQLKYSAVRCCLCPLSHPAHSDTLRTLQCRYVENKDGSETSGVMSKDLFIPGAGFTQSLHLKCIEAVLPCVSLMKFCSDGDNIPEALELAQTVDGWLNIVPSKENSGKTFVQPPSWKFIYGGQSPAELFP